MRRNRLSGDDVWLLFGALALLMAQYMIDAWCIGWYYYWFGVSSFGLPPMDFLTTVGIVIGLRFAISGFGSSSETKIFSLSVEGAIFRLVFVPVILWVIGFFLAAFIGV